MENWRLRWRWNRRFPMEVPRGAIIDVAPVSKGVIGRDCVVFADFIPNNWSAWPNTFQHIEILERGPEKAVVRAERDWGKVTVTTLYTLKSNSDSVEIHTTMTNGGDEALADLLSGLTLWPKRGYFFGVPGLPRMLEQKTEGAFSDRVVAYDEHWTVALHAPYADHIANWSMDMYRLHTLAPGASGNSTGWLQVGASGDLKPIVLAEIERKHLASGTVHGAVTAAERANRWMRPWWSSRNRQALCVGAGRPRRIPVVPFRWASTICTPPRKVIRRVNAGR